MKEVKYLPGKQMEPFFILLSDRFSKKGNGLVFVLAFIFFVSFFAIKYFPIRRLLIEMIESYFQIKIRLNHWMSLFLQYDLLLLLLSLSFLALFFIDIGNLSNKRISIIENYFATHKRIRTIVIIVPWMIIILLFISNNIDNPNFWFDESGQFWMSKGLNHYSQPFEKTGGFLAVVSNNVAYNLDPGGFTILLHYWTMISNSPSFLRLLPIIFFILSMVFVSKLCLQWFPNNLMSNYGGLILLFSKLLKHYAFELRPYSMEMFTAILSLYFCYKIPKILNNRKYAVIAGLSAAILVTSRYPGFIAVGVLGCITLIDLIHHGISKHKLWNYLCFITPISISSFIVYFFVLRKQNPGVNSPAYINHLMLNTGDISEILFSRSSLVVYFPFILLVLLFFLTSKTGLLKKFKILIIYTSIINIIFMGLSIIGKHPWAFNSRWDITTHTILTLSFLPLLFTIMNIVYLFFNNQKMVHLLFSILIIITTAIWAKYYQYRGNDSVYANYINCNVVESNKLLANINASPTIRYLFEYGPLINRDIIYKNISWYDDRDPDSSFSLETLDNIDQYDYILLTHYRYEGSVIESRIHNRNNWVECGIFNPSKMFVNTQ